MNVVAISLFWVAVVVAVTFSLLWIAVMVLVMPVLGQRVHIRGQCKVIENWRESAAQAQSLARGLKEELAAADAKNDKHREFFVKITEFGQIERAIGLLEDLRQHAREVLTQKPDDPKAGVTMRD